LPPFLKKGARLWSKFKKRGPAYGVNLKKGEARDKLLLHYGVKESFFGPVFPILIIFNKDY